MNEISVEQMSEIDVLDDSLYDLDNSDLSLVLYEKSQNVLMERTKTLMEKSPAFIEYLEKMKPAEYQEYHAKKITVFKHQGHSIRLVSGKLLGHEGVVKNVSTEPVYADITMNEGRLELKLPPLHNAFLYVFQGEGSVINDDGEANSVTSPRLVILTQGDRLVMETNREARFMLAAAQKIEEPIVRWGPFVMNTHEEVEQTLQEIRTGQFPPD